MKPGVAQLARYLEIRAVIHTDDKTADALLIRGPVLSDRILELRVQRLDVDARIRLRGACSPRQGRDSDCERLA